MTRPLRTNSGTGIYHVMPMHYTSIRNMNDAGIYSKTGLRANLLPMPPIFSHFSDTSIRILLQEDYVRK